MDCHKNTVMLNFHADFDNSYTILTSKTLRNYNFSEYKKTVRKQSRKELSEIILYFYKVTSESKMRQKKKKKHPTLNDRVLSSYEKTISFP